MDKLKVISRQLEKIIPDNFALFGEIWWSFALSSKNRFYKYTFKVIDEHLSSEESWGQVSSRCIKFAISTIGKIIFNNLVRAKVVNQRLKQLENQNIVLIKTFSFDNSNFEDFKDPFFGELGSYIAGKSYNVVTIVEPAGSFLVYLRRNRSGNVLSVYDFLKFKDLISLYFDLIDTAKKLWTIGALKEKQFYCKELFSPATLHSRLLFYAFRRCFKSLRPRSYIYTYENNSWEKMALLAISSLKINVKTIAYQHNVMPPASLNMYLGKNESLIAPSPDLILTTGEVPRRLFEKNSCYPIRQILTSCTLRYNYLFGMKVFPRIKTKKILVALEGVWPITDLIEKLFAINHSLSGFTFRFRFHPVLPAEAIETKLSFKLGQVKNFEVSKGISLVEDIKSCSAILYWGSTVGLEASMLGRPIINIQIGDINYDPLFELADFKKTWSVDKDLKELLESFEELTDKEFEQQRDRARSYIEAYFKPVSEDNLSLFLS